MSIADKLSQIAQNEQKVYDAGVAKGQSMGGYDDGYKDGHTAGQQAEYDRFWDAYQENGERKSYQYAFSGTGWTDETFHPKYSLAVMDSSNYMFAGSGIADISHLPGMNTKYGCGYMFFNNTVITHVGELAITGSNISATSIFQGATALQTIDKLAVRSDCKYSSAFTNCTSLANITFEGTIGNTISFANSPLTNDSVQSIVDHLADYAGATAKTLTLHLDVGIAMTDAQRLTVSAKNWILVY